MEKEIFIEHFRDHEVYHCHFLLTHFVLNRTSKLIICRSTSSSVRVWSRERDRNAALSPNARILVNALMGSSIAERTP